MCMLCVSGMVFVRAAAIGRQAWIYAMSRVKLWSAAWAILSIGKQHEMRKRHEYSSHTSHTRTHEHTCNARNVVYLIEKRTKNHVKMLNAAMHPLTISLSRAGKPTEWKWQELLYDNQLCVVYLSTISQFIHELNTFCCHIKQTMRCDMEKQWDA